MRAKQITKQIIEVKRADQGRLRSLVAYSIALCLVFLIGAAAASPVVALSDYSISPSTVKPGTSGSVSVTFINNGNSVASALSVYYGQLEGTAASGPKNAGDLAEGTKTTVIIPFTVADSYDAGVYSLPLQVFYSGSSSANFVIPVTVSKPPILQVLTNNVSKKAVKSGDEFEVAITLNNIGGEIKDISLSAPQNSSFQFSGVSKYVLSSLLSDSSADFALRMISGASVSTGTYSVPVTITYTDKLGTTSSENVSIGPVNVVDLGTLFSVSAEPISDAEVGSTLRLNVTISNNGHEDEPDVSVEPQSSAYIIPIGSTSVSFDTIPARGQASRTVLLGIDPLASSGYYSIPLKVRLGTGQSFNTSVGVLVSAASQLSVTSETTPATVAPGGSTSLTVKMSNVGDSAIRSVIVALSSDTVTISSGAETFLGTLNVDDTSSAVATVRASSSSKPEDNAITATITFKDSNNQEHKVEKTLHLAMSSAGAASATPSGAVSGTNGSYPSRSSSQGLMGLLPYAIGAIAVIVAAFFGYKWWKGKKGVKRKD
ncbi:Uncharacterised protein [uncultured archaeon]|nr:Uncharacterised protein [uncultured archaeon]